MITIKPSSHLTGVTIQGDFDDFYDLVDSIHRMVSDYEEDDDRDFYFGIKNRLFGICYDIRHAYQGEREVVLLDNGMNEDTMKWHNLITPEKNVYYSANVLFPEAVFVAASVPEIYGNSACYYGKKKTTEEPCPRPCYPLSQYYRDKANLDVLFAGIWQALGDAIGQDEADKLLRMRKRKGEIYWDYLPQYVDRCNLELLATDPEKRANKLKNIVKRLINKPASYMQMERELRYWAGEYNTSVHALKEARCKYPEEIVW